MAEKKRYPRLLDISAAGSQSLFLFGPRGTGKSSWLKEHFSKALFIDLLKSSIYRKLVADPSILEKLIPPDFTDRIIIDEIQKVPELLNEVHRLIESKGYRFIMTGSSARSLRRKGVNLLAGRALDYRMHPLTCIELGEDFSLETALRFGLLPMIYQVTDPKHYLESYIGAYLKEEVMQEGLARNIGNFTRFLEIASFSQGELVNYSEIGREIGVDRRVVTSYFDIVEDLLLGIKLPVFAKRAKRKLSSHQKFYFFDVGVYRELRPKGPLDSVQEMDGAALETLFFEHLRAYNDYFRWGFEFSFWRTADQHEVDFVAYGEKGLYAFEIKRKRHISPFDLKGLQAFGEDYEMAKLFLLYGGDEVEYHQNITVIPYQQTLFELKNILSGSDASGF